MDTMFKKLLILANIGTVIFIIYYNITQISSFSVGEAAYFSLVIVFLLGNAIAIFRGYTKRWIIMLLFLLNTGFVLAVYLNDGLPRNINDYAVWGLLCANAWRLFSFTVDAESVSLSAIVAKKGHPYFLSLNRSREKMCSKFLALEQSTRSGIIIAFVIIAVLSVAFYWYSYRPMMIKKECSTIARSPDHSIEARDASDGEYKICLRKNGIDNQ